MEKPKYNKNQFATGRYNAAAKHEENYIGKCIAAARKRNGLTLHEFSKRLSNYGLTITRQGISKWELGLGVPNAYQLLAVCHALDIDDGVGYFSGTPETLLNDVGLKKLYEYKQDLLASGRYKVKSVTATQIRYVDKPVSILPASAGTGDFLDDDYFEMVSFPESTVPNGADFGVRVSGDSMEPVYHDGQIVWVQACNALSPGEVGLFVYDGSGYIKVYDEQEPSESIRDSFMNSDGDLRMQPILVSYNRKYKPKPISPELSFQIVGKILN